MSLIATQDLSEQQWHIAHTMAQKLVLEGADANELGKVNAYLSTLEGYPNPKQHFFSYLTTLAKNGDKIGHSKKTKGYYQSMESVCKEYISEDIQELESLKQILGWTFRLMRYYKDGVPTGELDNIAAQNASKEILSERQKAVNEVLESIENLKENMEVEAEITDKKEKGKKITYKLFDALLFSTKEPNEKKFKDLKIGQMVKVEITRIDDGKIKKIKRIDPS